MVDPTKRYRYGNHISSSTPPRQSLSPEIPMDTGAEMHVASDAGSSDDDDEMDATQPSAAANLEATGTALGGDTQPSLPSPPRLPRTLPYRPDTHSEMDVVPDSEATQAAAPGMSPEISLPPTPPKSKDARRAQVPKALHSNEVVPDSFEEEAEDEGAEESDDDIPLVMRVGRVHDSARANAKVEINKQKSVASPPYVHAVDEDTRPVAGPSKRTERATQYPRKTRQKDAEDIVPSSYPHEEHVPAPPKKKGKGKAKKPAERKVKGETPPIRASEPPPATPPRVRSLRSHTSAGRSRLNYNEDSDNEDEKDTRDGSIGPAVPSLVPDDAKSHSERANTVDMDVDDEQRPASTTRKRKRRVSTPARNKRSTRANSSVPQEQSETPEPRKAKRRKSGSVARDSGTATRVFALWKQDQHYYPGFVQCLSASGQYEVHFDDDGKETLDVDHLRQCELREGDEVVLNKTHCVVLDNAPICTPTTSVNIRFPDDTEGTVELRHLKIQCEVVELWEDRKFDENDIVTAQQQREQPFHSMAFVLTFPPQFGKAEEQKKTLTATITAAGGVVLEDWADIFTLDGKMKRSSTRWELTRDEVRLKPKYNKIRRVFLLSDDTSNKPRFLIALALGIPCLDVRWVHDAIQPVSASFASRISN